MPPMKPYQINKADVRRIMRDVVMHTGGSFDFHAYLHMWDRLDAMAEGKTSRVGDSTGGSGAR